MREPLITKVVEFCMVTDDKQKMGIGVFGNGSDRGGERQTGGNEGEWYQGK